MKIKKQELKKFIDKMLMETFYYHPGRGLEVDESDREKEPYNIGELENAAKEEKNKLNNYLSTLSEIIDLDLNKLHFSMSLDLENNKKEIDKLFKENLPNLLSFIEIISSITGQEDSNGKAKSYIADYLSIITNTPESSGQFSLEGENLYTSLNRYYFPITANEIKDSPLANLFIHSGNKKIGLGYSLFASKSVSELIFNKLVTLENKTPQEFRDETYPIIEKVVNSVYKELNIASRSKLPRNKITKAKEVYLESISYVLGELIGELNFIYMYDCYEGECQPVFISPDMISPTDMTSHEWDRSINSIRDTPEYYNTKYTFNKKSIDLFNLSDLDIGMNFAIRISDNLVSNPNVDDFISPKMERHDLSDLFRDN